MESPSTQDSSREDHEDLAALLAELNDPSNKGFPEEALRKVQARRDEAIPFLMASIQEAITQVRHGENPSGDLYFHAIYLLAEFQAREALPILVEALSLPEEEVFCLWGDSLLEDFSQILSVLVGDQVEVLDRLLSDRACNEYVRWAVGDTYLFLVRDGRITREQAVQKLHGFLRDALEHEDDDVIGFLALILSSYGAGEALEEIREAYRREIISPFFSELKDMEQNAAKGTVAFEEMLAKCPESGISDAVEALRGWFPDEAEEEILESDQATFLHSELEFQYSAPPTMGETVINSDMKIGRNDPCPCGSGRKFKKCCGKI
jgi:hypothetical protein